MVVKETSIINNDMAWQTTSVVSFKGRFLEDAHSLLMDTFIYQNLQMVTKYVPFLQKLANENFMKRLWLTSKWKCCHQFNFSYCMHSEKILIGAISQVEICFIGPVQDWLIWA